MTSTKREQKALPKVIQQSLDWAMDSVIEAEKEEYQNDLVPFSQHEAQLREEGKKASYEIYQKLIQAKKLLKELFEVEEKSKKNLPFGAFFSRFEEGVANKQDDPEKSLQEQCGLSQEFMDRAYEKGTYLIGERRFDDAASVFLFLRYLNDSVFEYWYGEAFALHELGKFENALDSYAMSLLELPENPVVFFQMADCLYHLGNRDACLKVLTVSIEYCKEKPEYEGLKKNAEELKAVLQEKTA